jgi:hypothetical protein
MPSMPICFSLFCFVFFFLFFSFFPSSHSLPSSSLSRWTEFWFNRPDINEQGWQAVDATPQEVSDGKYQLGYAVNVYWRYFAHNNTWFHFILFSMLTVSPSSVNLVKANSLKIKYDSEFVSSETNADIRQYVAFDTGKPKHPYVPGMRLGLWWASIDVVGGFVVYSVLFCLFFYGNSHLLFPRFECCLYV